MVPETLVFSPFDMAGSPRIFHYIHLSLFCRPSVYCVEMMHCHVVTLQTVINGSCCCWFPYVQLCVCCLWSLLLHCCELVIYVMCTVCGPVDVKLQVVL
jgi:hypothetical protein